MSVHHSWLSPRGSVLGVRRGPGVRRLAALGVVTVAALLPLAGTASAKAPAGSAAPRASVTVDAPATVKAGQPITVRLGVVGGRDVSGYETSLLFAQDAAHLSGVSHATSSIARTGRDIASLGPVESGQSVSFGFYSCAASCATGKGRPSLRRRLRPRQARLPSRSFPSAPACWSSASCAPSSSTAAVASSRRGRRPSCASASVRPRRSCARPPPLLRWSKAAGFSALRSARKTDLDARRHRRERRRPGRRLPLDDAPLRRGSVRTRPHRRRRHRRRLRRRRRRPGRRRCLHPADPGASASPCRRSSTRSAPRPSATTPALAALLPGERDVHRQLDRGRRGRQHRRRHLPHGRQRLHAARRDRVGERAHRARRHRLQHPRDGSADDRTWRARCPTSATPPAAPRSTATPSPARARTPTRSPATPCLRIAITGGGDDVEYQAFRITSPNNTIRGLSIYSAWRKIWMAGPNARNNLVAGNFIGTDPAATYVSPNFVDSGDAAPDRRRRARQPHRRGDARRAQRDLGQPAQRRAHLRREHARQHRPQQHHRPLARRHAAASLNRTHGVDVDQGATLNIIGGTGTLQRNVLSGNSVDGIEIVHHIETTGNQVVGNYIGTDLTGNTAAGLHAQQRPRRARRRRRPEHGRDRQRRRQRRLRGGIVVEGQLTARHRGRAQPRRHLAERHSDPERRPRHRRHVPRACARRSARATSSRTRSTASRSGPRRTSIATRSPGTRSTGTAASASTSSRPASTRTASIRPTARTRPRSSR